MTEEKKTFVRTGVLVVSDEERAEVDATILEILDQLWPLQEEYENAAERGDYAEIQGIKERTSQILSGLLGESEISRLLSLRDLFFKLFWERYPDPETRPPCLGEEIA